MLVSDVDRLCPSVLQIRTKRQRRNSPPRSFMGFWITVTVNNRYIQHHHSNKQANNKTNRRRFTVINTIYLNLHEMFSAASATIIHRSTFLQCSAVAATTKTTATNGVVRNTVVIRRCGQQQQRLYHHHHQHQQQRQCSINHRHNFLSTVTTKKSNNNSIVSKNRRWLSSDSATGGGGGGGVVIKPLSKQERTALRAARRERATQVIAEAKGETASTGSATSGTSSSPSSIHSKYIWYASVFVPSALLVWGFSDPNSPPAKLCDLLGITGLVSSYTDEIAKPSHDKLLPDWSQVRCVN